MKEDQDGKQTTQARRDRHEAGPLPVFSISVGVGWLPFWSGQLNGKYRSRGIQELTVRYRPHFSRPDHRQGVKSVLLCGAGKGAFLSPHNDLIGQRANFAFYQPVARPVWPATEMLKSRIFKVNFI
ncbi:hypothetical protein G6N74_29815 [Mesorhizobium sp. CGMCC 1.15528]|uniref:Uncharacterized protein n=1 Tax=Mesorhizobium zhangyense TaxID=1776730 RepID=A0A7C9VIQ4_9HYPH|nr:hypothetical protein [Mesorhizobium zhangyense]NGN45251.1 hypothetical protein [Mesorhizobium zhangyense]